MSYSSTDFLTEWLTYSLNLKFEDETVFTNFAVSILQNINHFARPNRTDLCNYFYQFESINSNKYKINSRIRSFLATELLSHYDLDESHSLKEKKIENNIINDIYDLIQLSTASENAFRNTDISGIFNIINPDVNKKINNIQELYDNLNKIINQKHQVVLKQLKSSKDLISSQSKTISSLIEQIVYFGNININATTEEVKKELQRILNGITYDDFAEINENDPNRKFKSFKFSIGYLDKSIIDNKEIWPRYSIVNKFKLSLAEWQKISSTFKKKTDSMLTVAASKQTALSTLSTIESTSNSNKTNNTIADE